MSLNSIWVSWSKVPFRLHGVWSADGWFWGRVVGTKSRVFHHTKVVRLRMELTPGCGWRWSHPTAAELLFILPVVVCVGQRLENGHVVEQLGCLVWVLSTEAVGKQLNGLISLVKWSNRFIVIEVALTISPGVENTLSGATDVACTERKTWNILQALGISQSFIFITVMDLLLMRAYVPTCTKKSLF